MKIFPLRLIGPVALMIATQLMPQAAKRPIADISSRLDIYEAVVRYQIESWQQEAHTYCVEINGADPDPAFLQHLRPLHVKGASACRKQNDKRQMIVLDRKMKGSVIFKLGMVQDLTESQVELDGGYLCGNLCMAQGNYRVVHEASGWRVVGFEARLTF